MLRGVSLNNEKCSSFKTTKPRLHDPAYSVHHKQITCRSYVSANIRDLTFLDRHLSLPTFSVPPALLPTVQHKELFVASPSLYSPERSEGDGWCWTNLQNTHFSLSGQKSRVCVNAADRLTHPGPNSYCLSAPLPFALTCHLAFLSFPNQPP